ncbi:MAG: hypothetical protein M3Y13_02700, partial [Armatimonadota bacterium]|nr:hypothetical protein [Armatimonadota bacterium]
MQQFRFLPTRLVAVLGLCLVISSVGGWLPQRGAAQATLPQPSVSPNDPADNGPAETPTDNSVTDDGSMSDGASNTTSAQDNQDNGDANNGGNSDNSNGDANPNPAVGVDTVGHADAVATRNGRTTRRRRRITPANPLVITNPTRGNGPAAIGDTNGNRTPPLIPAREPGVYTLQTDPFQMGTRRNAKPLPLFGYDFFQPARQIIIARRRALLPPAPRVLRRPSRTNTRTSNSRSNRTTANADDSQPSGTTYSETNGNLNDGTANDGTSNDDTTNDAELGAAGVAARRRLPNPNDDGTETTGDSGTSDTTGEPNAS